MTISYNHDVINAFSLTFLRVIFRWKGSLWKSVFIEIWLWTLCYYLVLIVYRYYLDKSQQLLFEHVAKYMDGKMDQIPLIFMLGFYVAFVVDRWKQIFANIGFIDSAALFIATFIKGTDAEMRTTRRNILRYLCVTQILVLRDISIRVRKRFPTIESLVEAGLLQHHEHNLMELVRNDFPRYWMPIQWIFSISLDLTERGKISAGMMDAILQETKAYREYIIGLTFQRLQLLLNYDWVPVPLAYSQVVFMATRVYFLLCLFSRQFRIWEQHDSPVYVEYYFPLMTILQMVCFMGWLKVAECLLNPLGEDDDDFECNYIIDRNLSVGMTMVDECHGQMPSQFPDNIGREGEKAMYSEKSLNEPQNPLIGSAELAAKSNNTEIGDENASVRMVERDTASAQQRQRKTGIHFIEQALQRTLKRRRRNQQLNKSAKARIDDNTILEENGNGNGNVQPWNEQDKSKSVACFPVTAGIQAAAAAADGIGQVDFGLSAKSAPAALDQIDEVSSIETLEEEREHN